MQWPRPGQRERAVELHEDFGRALEQALRLEVEHEEARGQHRAHRVRGRRADADLEDVEDGQVHSAASRRRISDRDLVRERGAQRLLLVLLREHRGLVVAVIARELHVLAREQFLFARS